MSKVHCGPIPSSGRRWLILIYSGRLSLHLGHFLFTCLHLSLQLCFLSFKNAAVAEVLNFFLILDMLLPNDLMMHIFQGICSLISKLFSTHWFVHISCLCYSRFYFLFLLYMLQVSSAVMRLCSPILCCLDEQIFYILTESGLYILILHHISRNNTRKIKGKKEKVMTLRRK